MDDREALNTQARLAAMGVEIRSAELRETLERHENFAANGNRALRRHRARSERLRGRGVTR